MHKVILQNIYMLDLIHAIRNRSFYFHIACITEHIESSFLLPLTLFFFFCFVSHHSQFSSCSLLMSGVPTVYYHGTGSENAGRAYTETPMQHIQRNVLRKKCMKSTFTLCSKYAPKNTSPSLSTSVNLSHVHALICRVLLSSSITFYLEQKYSLCYAHSSKVQFVSLEYSSRIVQPRLLHFVCFCLRLYSPYGKFILIPKCISMHRVLLQGISHRVVSTLRQSISIGSIIATVTVDMWPNRSRGGKRCFKHPHSMEKADTVDTSESFLSA